MDDAWNVVSGYRRTTIEVPIYMFEAVQAASEERSITFNEFVEESIKEKLEKE